MVDSNMGVKTRLAGDCGDSPINAVWYSGATNAVPLLVAGNITFPGGTTLHGKPRGIGYTGSASGAANNVHKIVYADILTGGSGVKIRACGTSLKKKVRFKCCDANCGESIERTAIQVRAISNCQFPKWQTWVAPYEVFTSCGCIESCCQKTTQLVKLINADLDSPVVATQVIISDVYYIDIESKVAGQDFLVIAQEGLKEGTVIVPNFNQAFNARSMQGWFGTDVIGPCDADVCLTVLEIFYYDTVPYRGTAGTSNPNTDPTEYHKVLTQSTIVFNTAVANSLAAFNALKTILTGTTEHNKKMTSTAATDFPVYAYCVVRTDAGDPAALADAVSDYTTNIIQLGRKNYVDGKSYYSLLSTSATPPTADGADVVALGSCGTDDLPCSTPDGCPEVEGGCVNCG